MKLTQFIFCLLFVCYINPAYAVLHKTFVPFQNIALNYGDVIEASYIFSNPIIFCYTGNQQEPEGVINWPFQKKRIFSHLPVQLKVDPQFEGFFADQSGVIQIQNNIAQVIIVSCDFGF